MEEEKQKKNIFMNLKWYEHLMAGWPLILVFAGGAIGGVCGALAYFLSAKTFNSELPNHLKYIYSLIIGVGSFGLYLVIIITLVNLFPGLVQGQ